VAQTQKFAANRNYQAIQAHHQSATGSNLQKFRVEIIVLQHKEECLVKKQYSRNTRVDCNAYFLPYDQIAFRKY
jgi:hypothetical protein